MLNIAHYLQQVGMLWAIMEVGSTGDTHKNLIHSGFKAYPRAYIFLKRY